MAYPSPDLNDW